jgi:hypothetical protein
MSLFLMREKQYAEQVKSEKLSKVQFELLEKEQKLIEMFKQTDFSLTDLNMIYTKSKFIEKDIEVEINHIKTDSSILKEVAEIQILTLSNTAQRVHQISEAISNTIDSVKQAHLLGVQAEQQEQLKKLINEIERKEK